MRQTSIETFNQIKSQGLIGRIQFEIYQTVFHYGPMTAHEVFNKLNLETNQSGRFTELKDKGVFQEVGSRPCKITGRNAILWDVTCKLPVETKRRVPKFQWRKGYNQAIDDVKRALQLSNGLIDYLRKPMFLESEFNNLRKEESYEQKIEGQRT